MTDWLMYVTVGVTNWLTDLINWLTDITAWLTHVTDWSIETTVRSVHAKALGISTHLIPEGWSVIATHSNGWLVGWLVNCHFC